MTRSSASPLHVAHRQVRERCGLADSIDRDDVGVVQRRRHLGLALESPDDRGAEQQVGRQYFERDRAPELPFHSPVHDRHPAATDLALDIVVVRELPANELEQGIARPSGAAYA